MASVVGDTTCVLHAERHAAARCPECWQFYCSECITEHEGRLTCASCLAAPSQEAESRSKGGRFVSLLAVGAQVVVAVMVCWLVFYLFAQTMGDMPDDFHDGTIWE